MGGLPVPPLFFIYYYPGPVGVVQDSWAAMIPLLESPLGYLADYVYYTQLAFPGPTFFLLLTPGTLG